MDIREEFGKITGFKLSAREVNRFSDEVERKDWLFTKLAHFYFTHPDKFDILKKRVTRWLKLEKSAEILALAGYVYYIAEDFKQARKFFLDVVHWEPDNIDSWIDLAFCLRHLEEYEVSNGIFFNLYYVIHYYKYFKLNNRGRYTKLKNLVLEICKRRAANLYK